MSLNLPSLNWLRVFEAAARHESFARAAQELNMSAAAVSQQVRALEDRLRRPLFERGRDPVRRQRRGGVDQRAGAGGATASAGSATMPARCFPIWKRSSGCRYTLL